MEAKIKRYLAAFNNNLTHWYEALPSTRFQCCFQKEGTPLLEELDYTVAVLRVPVKFAGETREGWYLLTVETEVNGDLLGLKEYK
jgi:hypothetical protein